MHNLSDDINTYFKDGFLVFKDLFSHKEISMIKDELSKYVLNHYDGITYENDNKTIRGILGCHLNEKFFADLVCDPRLAEMPRKILGDHIYVHQFKVNYKIALNGSIWPWHQDFIYWHNEDGMPRPDAISVGLFLDDVTEFNGPLTFVKGSHNHNSLKQKLPFGTKSDWQSTVSSTLKYELDGETLRELYEDDKSLYAPKGKAGSTILFHPLIAHGSTSNLSFKNRALLIITYNSIKNSPPINKMTRPLFLANKNFTPIHISKRINVEELTQAEHDPSEGSPQI